MSVESGCPTCVMQGRQCVECKKKYNAEYYRKNKDKIVARRQQLRAENPDYVRSQDRERLKRYKDRKGEEYREYMRKYMRDYHVKKSKSGSVEAEVAIESSHAQEPESRRTMLKRLEDLSRMTKLAWWKK